MDNRIPLHNPGTSPLHVGGVVIPPNDTRLVDPTMVPPHLRRDAPAPEPEPAENPVVALMGGKAADIIAALTGLSDEDLAGAQVIEGEAKKPRSTVVEAITAEQLRRAAATAGEGKGAGNDDDTAGDKANLEA